MQFVGYGEFYRMEIEELYVNSQRFKSRYGGKSQLFKFIIIFIQIQSYQFYITPYMTEFFENIAPLQNQFWIFFQSFFIKNIMVYDEFFRFNTWYYLYNMLMIYISIDFDYVISNKIISYIVLIMYFCQLIYIQSSQECYMRNKLFVLFIQLSQAFIIYFITLNLIIQYLVIPVGLFLNICFVIQFILYKHIQIKYVLVNYINIQVTKNYKEYIFNKKQQYQYYNFSLPIIVDISILKKNIDYFCIKNNYYLPTKHTTLNFNKKLILKFFYKKIFLYSKLIQFFSVLFFIGILVYYQFFYQFFF